MFYWILACIAKDIYILIENFIHSCIPSSEKKHIYVKNKPILGGIIHLQIVTLCPGRTVNPHCVPVIDLGFGFLICERCAKTSSSQQLPVAVHLGNQNIVYSSKCLEYIILDKLAPATPVLENMKNLYTVLK